jgi:hypothetical protein
MASLSPRTRLAAAALLLLAIALSFGLKLALAGNERPIDEERFLADLAARFAGRGYQVRIVRRRFQPDIVLARAGPCLVSARYADQGPVLDEEYRRNAAGIGPLFYVHGGQASVAPPSLVPAFGLSLQLMLGKLGIDTTRAPAIAVAARLGCAPPPAFFDGLKVSLRR